MIVAPDGSSEQWRIILSLENGWSPFWVDESGIFLADQPVMDIVALENDDVVLSYLRAGGRSLTLNTHTRSSCVGCAFCPNVIEDAADDPVSGVAELERLLSWVMAEHDWVDLSHVEVITVCSGCFEHANLAVRHLADLRAVAGGYGFRGRIHFLSSVVRERSDIAALAESAGPFHLTLTLECFARRPLLLKSTKASLTLEKACRILDDCTEFGVTGDFTYIVGLDPLRTAIDGVKRLAEHISTFPRIQVYQPHNPYMLSLADSELKKSLQYLFAFRAAVEPALASANVRPRSWENYRPLWYTEFAGAPVGGPRV
jgi:hypothetical protein